MRGFLISLMYIYQISITADDKALQAGALEEFERLVDSYLTSGQRVGQQRHSYVSNGRLVAQVYTHEEQSLHKQYNNLYVNLRTESLERLCNATVEVNQVGTEAEVMPVCTCAKSNFYLLITEHNSIASPIKCGTCFDVVPMYKLPPLFDNGYYPLLSWESNYQACDGLQQNGIVGEAWALEQMENPNSELSVEGREVCTSIEQSTQTPTYYFMRNSKESTIEQELDSICPACRQPWLLTQPLAGGIFPFKCDNCRLISAFSSNIVG